ncbi:hypothetical protein SO694_00141070 [Aureococcus anophagefferens]|uniref:HAT C-terminal dimerisation domain-containing protein n=1 Tax=Aureococcus anophagefferens TaxID=44056 RepID=A0ABR1FPJ1_AURAN
MVNTLKGFRKWRSLKGSDMAALIGKRSSVMGKFWDGCSKDDEDKLYPCVIKEYDDRKKIARIAALQQMATEDEPEAGEEAPVPLTKEEVRQKKALAASRKASGFACASRRRSWSTATSRGATEQYKMMLRSGETKAGGKTIVSADGSLITRLKFEDAFNYHVDWVSMCYTDAVPFHRAKTPGTRRFAASLRPGYVPPTRDTSIKVLAVMDELMTEAADAKISAHVRAVGGACVSWQLDMMTSCGVAYVTLNLSFVDDEKSGFVHKNVQLAACAACTYAALRPLALKAMFKVFKKLALYTTKESTKFNEAMKAAQRACGIRAIEIEPALRMTLKKTHADLRGDEIIDGELDEAAVEETASIVSSDDEDSSSSDDDDDGGEAIESKDLLPEVREAISIMISQVKERFFAPGMVTDRDMIALHMNPLVKVSDVFGGGSAGDAASKAATQLYSALYFETSARIGRQAGEKTKLSEVESNRTKRSKGEKSLLDQAFDDLDGSSDDDASMDVDACEMTWLDELRSTPKKERKDRFEFKAGLDGEKHFSALQFYSKLRMRAPVHAAMAQQIFADEATEGVSERSFSIHSLYTSKLRKALQGKVIAPMLRCKANHDLFFEEIKAKIYERYFRKYRNNVDAFPRWSRRRRSYAPTASAVPSALSDTETPE